MKPHIGYKREKNLKNSIELLSVLADAVTLYTKEQKIYRTGMLLVKVLWNYTTFFENQYKQ
jgi:hypothetical protein